MQPNSLMTFSGIGLMALTMLLAYVDNRLFPGQMIAHHAAKGFPGIANGALWGNLFLMSFAVFLIGLCWDQWSRGNITVSLVLGTALSFYAFVFVYRTGLHDDAWAGAGEIHPAGIIAMIYTAGLIAAFILFYVFSSVERTYVWIIAGLLILYLPLANHVVLNFFNELQHFVFCPQIFKEEVRPLIIMRGGLIFVAAITSLKLFFPKAWL